MIVVVERVNTSWHPSNHNREYVITMRNWGKVGRILVVFCLFLSVSLAYSLSNQKHDMSSFPPIPNIAGAALVIMANNAEDNDPLFIWFTF